MRPSASLGPGFGEPGPIEGRASGLAIAEAVDQKEIENLVAPVDGRGEIRLAPRQLHIHVRSDSGISCPNLDREAWGRPG
jgi:hypothetical protein